MSSHTPTSASAEPLAPPPILSPRFDMLCGLLYNHLPVASVTGIREEKPLTSLPSNAISFFKSIGGICLQWSQKRRGDLLLIFQDSASAVSAVRDHWDHRISSEVTIAFNQTRRAKDWDISDSLVTSLAPDHRLWLHNQLNPWAQAFDPAFLLLRNAQLVAELGRGQALKPASSQAAVQPQGTQPIVPSTTQPGSESSGKAAESVGVQPELVQAAAPTAEPSSHQQQEQRGSLTTPTAQVVSIEGAAVVPRVADTSRGAPERTERSAEALPLASSFVPESTQSRSSSASQALRPSAASASVPPRAPTSNSATSRPRAEATKDYSDERTLWITGLNPNSTSTDVAELFTSYGTVVRTVLRQHQGESYGTEQDRKYAFVEMATTEAVDAIVYAAERRAFLPLTVKRKTIPDRRHAPNPGHGQLPPSALATRPGPKQPQPMPPPPHPHYATAAGAQQYQYIIVPSPYPSTSHPPDYGETRARRYSPESRSVSPGHSARAYSYRSSEGEAQRRNDRYESRRGSGGDRRDEDDERGGGSASLDSGGRAARAYSYRSSEGEGQRRDDRYESRRGSGGDRRDEDDERGGGRGSARPDSGRRDSRDSRRGRRERDEDRWEARGDRSGDEQSGERWADDGRGSRRRKRHERRSAEGECDGEDGRRR